jgi:hypothetical protein
MKKMILAAALAVSSLAVNAQSEKYASTMTELSTSFQTQFEGSLIPLVNKMERVATAETKEWLPQYWVAFGLINESYRITNNDEKDVMLDKAETFIKKAEAISPKNPEIEILKAQFCSARLSVDPMGRWQKYGAMYETAVNEAVKLDASNPRIDYLKATNLYYTPEAFGGSKEKAKVLFESTLKKHNAFKTANAYSPNWGKVESEYFLSQYK